MGLKDTIAAAQVGAPQQRVLFKSFYVWYDKLSIEDREDLDAALISPGISTKALFYALKEHEGVTFGDNALYYHKRTLTKEN